ncbi:MAG: antibiotic biosynthesis monooxygenase [candidate division NC10 bacterium]|nr:antibiotic biosynthesis monooxygenase [candidate division NC10 bacterium]MBI3086096.1 antibiotic biosynthesis monooxygenase [candidate division NC10 bacterium]
MTDPLTVIARARARPGKEAALEAALEALLLPTHQEPGCLHYSLHRCNDIPGQFITYERWASREALDAHFSSAHVQALLSTLDALLAEPPEIVTYAVVPGGLPEKTRIG